MLEWFRPSIFVRALVADMNDNPGDYVQTEYTLVHTKTRMEIWTSGGLGYFGTYHPNREDFSRIDQRLFARSWDKWKAVTRISKMGIMAGSPPSGAG